MEHTNPASEARETASTPDRVVILGGRIAAHATAGYLRRQFPELEIISINRPGKPPPVVGESTIEASTAFLRACGFDALLEENHFHKFGLTFYYKLRLDQPRDRLYAIHEEPAIPPLPACLVNRFTFDRDARKLNEARGVLYVDGTVVDVWLVRGQHRVTYRDADGVERTLTARWVVDASGRSRVLAKKLRLTTKAKRQRSTFWFRLEAFDRGVLDALNTEMRQLDRSMCQQMSYDPYSVTHHFMGRGNWIWCIPVTSETGKDTISIGITYRPDLYPSTIRSTKEFIDAVEKEHPIIADLVRSGNICEGDTNVYLNYMYGCRQHYSEDGWFIVGDAANAVDPLYSNGLMLMSVQVMQAAAIIGNELGGFPDPDFVRDADRMYRALYDRAQDNIGDHYAVMHDPYQSSLRVHWVTTIYFYFVLPWFLCGYHSDPMGVRLMERLITTTIDLQESAYALFGAASRARPALGPSDVFNWYHDTINYGLLTARESDLPAHLSRMLEIDARIRLRALQRAGWPDKARQLTHLGRELTLALLLKTAFHDQPLKGNRAFARLLGLAGAVTPSLPARHVHTPWLLPEREVRASRRPVPGGSEQRLGEGASARPPQATARPTQSPADQSASLLQGDVAAAAMLGQ
jgi:2-polyprenyl-6-methoxyphenol hydroxylase-like FAD-dependent oxidoreductase